MAIDSDDQISLPAPPPPRPAARREAIEAALRKFDGIEDAPAERPTRSWWASHQRQMGGLVTATVIAVVGIPVALSVLRDQPTSVAPQASEPSVVREDGLPSVQAEALSETRPVEPDGTRVADATSRADRAPVTALVPLERRNALESFASEQKAASEAPAAAVAAAPPPPPPPAPAPARTEQYAADVPGQDMVVTGSRIRSPNVSAQNDARVVGEQVAKTSPLKVVDTYGPFLSRLQAALRENDREAVIGLIGIPLRVKQNGDARTYRSAEEVERDFDEIFTPRVRQSILNQRADDLRSRDKGRMQGNGRIWFGQSSPAGPILVREVNP